MSGHGEMSLKNINSSRVRQPADLVNPRRACAARITVLGLSVRLS